MGPRANASRQGPHVAPAWPGRQREGKRCLKNGRKRFTARPRRRLPVCDLSIRKLSGVRIMSGGMLLGAPQGLDHIRRDRLAEHLLIHEAQPAPQLFLALSDRQQVAAIAFTFFVCHVSCRSRWKGDFRPIALRTAPLQRQFHAAAAQMSRMAHLLRPVANLSKYVRRIAPGVLKSVDERLRGEAHATPNTKRIAVLSFHRSGGGPNAPAAMYKVGRFASAESAGPRRAATGTAGLRRRHGQILQ